GFAGARSRQNTVDIMTLIKKTSIDPPSRNAETDTQSLSGWRARSYSKTRRGMPSSPTANNGRNVELKKMNMVQKGNLPSDSFTLMPSIFASQSYKPPLNSKTSPPLILY